MTRRPGPDSTLDECRNKLIQAAIALMRRRGVNLGLDNISLSDAICEAGVTRSTAYRSLADDHLAPQAVLRRELLLYLLMRYTRQENREAIRVAVEQELERHQARLESNDVVERTVAMRAIIRAGTNISYENAVASPERAILIALYGALRSTDTHDWRHEALADGERGMTVMFSSFYVDLLEVFDYQFKQGCTIERLTLSAAALLEGLAMRDGFNDELVMVDRASGPGGAVEKWSLFALGFESLVVGMCEPRNRENPWADLSLPLPPLP